MAGESKGKAKDRACYQKPSVSHVTHRYVWLLNVLAALMGEEPAQFRNDGVFNTVHKFRLLSFGSIHEKSRIRYSA